MTEALAAILVFQAGWFGHGWYTKSRARGRTIRSMLPGQKARKTNEPPNVTEVA